MKFKQYRNIRHYIRNKILLPIANKLIDIRPRSVRIIRDGVQYEARYHRTRYWYDSERITIKGILDKRKAYHIDYWDFGETGRGGCEMFGWGPSMFTVQRGNNIKSVTSIVTKNLNYVIDMWLEHVVKPSKEKETKKPDFTNHTGDDYEN